MFNNITGKNIAYYRKLNKISQRQLAKDIGVSNTYISLIENGKSRPSREVLEKISDSLGIKIEALTDYSLTDEERLVNILTGLTRAGIVNWEASPSYNNTFITVVKEVIYTFIYSEERGNLCLSVLSPPKHKGDDPVEYEITGGTLSGLKEEIYINLKKNNSIQRNIEELKSLLEED